MNQLRAFLRSYWTPAGRQALGNFVGLGLGIGVGNVCAFVAMILLTRSLSPEEFGRVSFGLAVQSYLLSIGGLGASVILVREVARHPADADRYLSSYLTLVSGGAAIVAVVHVTVAALAPLSADERWLHVAIAIGTGPFAYAVVPLFDAFHKQALSAAVLAMGEVFGLAALVAYDRLELLGLLQVGLAYAMKWAVMTLGLLFVYNRFVRRPRWGYDRATIVGFVRSGLPVLVSSLVTLVPLSSGILFVRAYHGEAQAGLYGVAAQFATGVYLVGLIGNRILLPHISGAHGLDRSFVRKLIPFELSLVLVLVALGWAAGTVATVWLLPADYADVPAILGLLLVGAAAILGAGVVQSYQVRFHREREMMAINVGGAILYVALVLVTVPEGGVMAAAATAAFVSVAIAATSLAGVIRYARHSA